MPDSEDAGTVKKYAVVSAPAGTGLREAAARIVAGFPKGKIRHVDVEEVLCGLSSTREALKEAGRTDTDDPNMGVVTFYLSPDRVVSLCEEALRNALQTLQSGNVAYRLLSCHLSYYGTQRYESYISIAPSSLVTSSIHPSHVLMLIDDVFDMYLRLSGPEQIYSPYFSVRTLLAREAVDSGADSISKLLLRLQKDPNESIYRCLQSQVDVLDRLLEWRELDLKIAKYVKRLLGTNLLIFGTKQLTKAAVTWLQSEHPSTLYLSHPISSARRQYVGKGTWPSLIEEANRIPSLFLDKDDDKNPMVVVMPTAIDERRLSRSFVSGLLRRQTLLEKRWPLSASEGDLLYRLPPGTADPDHSSVLEYRVLKGDKVVPLSAGNPGYKPSPKTHLRADALLSSFEQAFHRHLSARDYGLVSLTGSILIFRPFFFRPKSSHGVSEELQYWELLAKADSKRRAVFVHFADDLKRWREYWVSNKAERETAVMTRKIRKILAKTGLSQDKIAATLKHENSFLGSSKVLGADEARILSENSKADKEAAEEWDFEQLSLAGCGKTSISQSRSIY